MDPWSREEEEEEGEEEMGEEEEKGQQGKIPEARGSLVLGHTRPEPRVREAGKEGAVHRRFGWWLQWLTWGIQARLPIFANWLATLIPPGASIPFAL